MVNLDLEKAERGDKLHQKNDSSNRTAVSLIKEILSGRKDKGRKYGKLMKILCDPFYLLKCYEEIKSNPGNMTKGLSHTTLDKIEWQ